MKRFTETGKWGDPWFRKLPPKIKLLWLYICDTCDAAGVFELDAEMASLQIGLEVQESDLEALSSRLEKVASGKTQITKFIPFQYGELSTECRPHKVVFDAIKKHKLEYPTDTLSIGYQYPTRQEQDKDKDRGKKGAGKKGGSPKGFTVPECFAPINGFTEALSGWIAHRKAIRKPATSRAIQLVITKLSEKPHLAVRVLDLIVEKGWQSFEWDWKEVEALSLKTNGHHQPSLPIAPAVPSDEEVALAANFGNRDEDI